jgi:hypothetical protein
MPARGNIAFTQTTFAWGIAQPCRSQLKKKANTVDEEFSEVVETRIPALLSASWDVEMPAGQAVRGGILVQRGFSSTPAKWSRG